MDRGTARTDRHGWRWGCWYWDRSMTQIRAETRRRALLFSPFRLREVTFPNRVVIGPMQMYAAAADGLANDWHFQHLAKYAVGGAGTVMTEALIVDPIGRNTYADCGIWSDAQVPPLRRIVDFLHRQGSLAAAQLHHCGPKASRRRPWQGLGPLDEEDAGKGEPAWQPVSSTDEPSTAGWLQPRPLTIADIRRLVEDYRHSARRAAEADFDVLEIHGAHGYLLHAFLSPIANRRTDAYGGEIAGRMRLALEIAESVRSAWPAGKPLFFRISAVDWRADLDARSDGWSIADSCTLARELAARGVDLIDCSSGGIRAENSIIDYAKRRQPLKRNYQVPYAEAIRRATGIPTMAVGAILDGPQAETILQRGQADLVAVARQALVEPHWALRAAQALGVDPQWTLWPPSYGWWLELRARTGIVD
jgi:2,4-dienoyl-CoA reductase-like NADH-dependent reductase (Old Yellow Enzyme family)